MALYVFESVKFFVIRCLEENVGVENLNLFEFVELYLWQ